MVFEEMKQEMKQLHHHNICAPRQSEDLLNIDQMPLATRCS